MSTISSAVAGEGLVHDRRRERGVAEAAGEIDAQVHRAVEEMDTSDAEINISSTCRIAQRTYKRRRTMKRGTENW
jgi:hypothetical protein